MDSGDRAGQGVAGAARLQGQEEMTVAGRRVPVRTRLGVLVQPLTLAGLPIATVPWHRGAPLLDEEAPRFMWPGARDCTAKASDLRQSCGRWGTRADDLDQADGQRQCRTP